MVTDRFERSLIEEISELRLEMREGFRSLRQEMVTLKVDLLRWSFLVSIAQVAAMAGIIAVLF